MSGCSAHRAYIYDRGGETRIDELWPLTQVRWDRQRDATSVGNILALTPDPRCHQTISDIEPGRHELVIFRNGERVWEGPIVRTAENGRSIEVDARDITHYLNRTIMRRLYNNAYPKITYSTERMRKILKTELARKENLDPPINVVEYLDIRTHKGTARTSSKTLPYEKYVFEELDNLAWKGGLDYTVIGRRLVINDVHDDLGHGPMLTEDSFDGEIVITAYGMETCTLSAVTDGEGHFGTWGGNDDYYGNIELLHSNFDEEDSTKNTNSLQYDSNGKPLSKKQKEKALKALIAELTAQAKRNAAGRYPTPIVLRVPEGSTLNPAKAEEMLDLLIPGIRFPVRSTKTYRQITQWQKLDKVSFVENADGEKIGVTLSPVPGSTPWDDGTSEE